jgi:hypothetical protein
VIPSLGWLHLLTPRLGGARLPQGRYPAVPNREVTMIRQGQVHKLIKEFHVPLIDWLIERLNRSAVTITMTIHDETNTST